MPCYDFSLMANDRYSRQILFGGIGPEGQARLAAARVLLVGCGALGSVIAEILVRAGVGELTIADRDYVDESNLQRQSLYTEADCRDVLPKAVAAARHLREINSGPVVVEQVIEVRAGNIASLVEGKHVVLDGTDNFETRYLVNDACLKSRVPWTYGACVGAYGICFAIVPGVTPCLRCILRQLPAPGSSPTCDTAGIVAPIVHLVAAFETAEALKILTGRLDRLNRDLVTVDLWENQVSRMNAGASRDPDCPACGRHEYEFLDASRPAAANELCGRHAVQVRPGSAGPVDLELIASRLSALGPVTCNSYMLKAQVGDHEIALFRDGRGIIRGTQDIDEARRIYSNLIGT